MDNPQTSATLCITNTIRRQTKHNQKTKKYEQHGPQQNTEEGVNPCAREAVTVFISYNLVIRYEATIHLYHLALVYKYH
jgi:hypothetical protein